MRVCACAWALADGMTHLDWAVLYLGMRACYIRLRSGWGSDGKVYRVARLEKLLETKRPLRLWFICCWMFLRFFCV